MPELRRSVSLDREPSLREGERIRDAVARELESMGADISRTDRTALRFRMPAPWRTRRFNPLVASGGTLVVDAGHGGPRRVRFALAHARLWLYTLVVAAIVFMFELHAPRRVLLISLGAVWLIVFALPWLLATLAFRRLVRRAATSVLHATPAAPPA